MARRHCLRSTGRNPGVGFSADSQRLRQPFRQRFVRTLYVKKTPHKAGWMLKINNSGYNFCPSPLTYLFETGETYATVYEVKNPIDLLIKLTLCVRIGGRS